MLIAGHPRHRRRKGDLTMSAFLERLPSSVRVVISPIFSKLPPDTAMAVLLPEYPLEGAEEIAADAVAAWAHEPALLAGLWLYLDNLESSHTISQRDASPVGAYWHGIMHRREGDFSNAKYWFRQTGSLPNLLNLDPASLTDEVARRYRDNPAHLVEAQRREWEQLFEYCARQTE